MHDQRHVRVTLLGALEVVRADGSTVSADEWRTGKTMDLLRILALNNGRPVRSASLIEKLWPNATPEHGRGSLRTASSQIRRALHAQCVVRQPEGLILEGAWVDAIAFVEETRRVSVAAREGQHAQVVEITRAAERLYAGDFHANDDESEWAIAERDHLIRARHEMLCAAATSALELRAARDALELATTAVRTDRSSETAYRLLMRAHAEAGEIGSALRVFETYRARIAEELGADPSPQTRELHLRLLRGHSA